MLRNIYPPWLLHTGFDGPSIHADTPKRQETQGTPWEVGEAYNQKPTILQANSPKERK